MYEPNRLPGDAEAVCSDRVDVLSPPHQDNIVSDGQEPTDEAPHRAGAEDEDFHVPGMRNPIKNPSDAI